MGLCLKIVFAHFLGLSCFSVSCLRFFKNDFYSTLKYFLRLTSSCRRVFFMLARCAVANGSIFNLLAVIITFLMSYLTLLGSFSFDWFIAKELVCSIKLNFFCSSLFVFSFSDAQLFIFKDTLRSI